MPEVVGGGECGGEQVPKPSDNGGGVEEVSFKFDGGFRVGGPLAAGLPVDEFGFGDRERDAYVPASLGNGGEQSLELAYVAPVGGGGHSD